MLPLFCCGCLLLLLLLLLLLPLLLPPPPPPLPPPLPLPLPLLLAAAHTTLSNFSNIMLGGSRKLSHFRPRRVVREFQPPSALVVNKHSGHICGIRTDHAPLAAVLGAVLAAVLAAVQAAVLGAVVGGGGGR